MRQQYLVLALMVLFMLGDMLATELVLSVGGHEVNPLMVNRAVRWGFNFLLVFYLWYLAFFTGGGGIIKWWIVGVHLVLKGLLTGWGTYFWFRHVVG